MKRAYLCLFSEENEEIVVFVPDLPGCYSAGDDLQEAREMAKEVMAISIEETVKVGEPIPEPKMSTLAEAEEWLAELMRYPLEGETEEDFSMEGAKLHVEMIEIEVSLPKPVAPLHHD